MTRQKFLTSRRVRPLPTAEVEGGFLRLWFGDRDRPALELEPIDLAELI